MTDPYNLTVAQASEQIRQGQLSAVELAESLLGRIDALEPRLKAWVTIDRELVLDTARQRDLDLAEKGPSGSLHGIPVGLKDIYFTAGMKTTACSKIYADFVPDYDATTAIKLKEAGAIILGKAVCTEFATLDPSPTVNPWDPACTAGGSSSGSAVAARMCPATMGSQTAGSILRPAAYNGVVGLKPTYGRVSRYGVFPLAWSLDTMGPLTRTVEDAAILLGVLAGHDPQDAASSTEPVADYRRALDDIEGPPRIGLIRGPFFERSEEEVRSHTEDVAQRLSKAGAKMEEVKLPERFSLYEAAQMVVNRTECAAVHQENFRQRADDYGPKLRRLIETGMMLPGVWYVQAQRLGGQFQQDMRELLSQVDLLLMPTSTSPAPRDLTTTGDPVFQSPWTFCGLPTISIPSGLSLSGLPLRTQLIGRPFEEAALLSAARWCEATLDVELTPPDLA